MKDDLNIIPALWAEAIRRNLYKPSPFPFMWRRRTWGERLMSWPWRPWKKFTIVTEPPKEAERGDRVQIRSTPAVRVAVVEDARSKYLCPPTVQPPNTAAQWSPSGRGETCRLRLAGYVKPEPVGPTEVQIDLSVEVKETNNIPGRVFKASPENYWLPEDPVDKQ